MQANTIAWSAELGGMGFMTIAAGDACRKHLALLERTVIVHLISHLAVGMIQATSKERDGVRVGQGLSRHPFFRKFAASGMAQPAGLDLPACHRGGDAALRIAGFRIELPSDAVALVQENGQSFARVIILFKPAPLVVRPIDGGSPCRGTPRSRR